MAMKRINDPYNSPAGGTVAPTYDFGSGAPIPGGSAGGNPFGALFGGGGGSGTVAAAPAPAPAAQSPSYNAVIDPSRPGLLGLIGRLSGAPTREEYMQDKYANLQRQGLIGLQKRLDEGMPMQAAVLDFMNSPEGVGFFTSSNDPIGTIKGYVQAMQKSRDIRQAGNSFIDFTNPDKPEVLYKNEENTTEQKDFNYFADVAGWTPEQKKAAADRYLNNKTAPKNLVPTTIIGQYGPQPALLDMNTMQITPLEVNTGPAGTAPSATQPAAGATPQSGATSVPQVQGTAPAAPQAAAAASPEDEGRPSGDIILGTGPYSVLQSTAGSYLAPLDPEAVDTQNEARRNAVQQIQFAAQSLRGAGSGSRAVSSDVKRLDSIVKGVSATTDPMQLGQSYLDFWDYLDRQERTAKKRSSEADLDTGTRKDWSDRLAEVRSVRDMLPTRESIKAAMEAYKKGPSQVERGTKDAPAAAKKALGKAEEAGKAAEDAAGFPANPAPDVAAHTFTSEADVQKALDAGTVKYGDTIMFNGQPMRIEQ